MIIINASVYSPVCLSSNVSQWVEELAARKHEMDALFTPKDRLRFAMELRLRLLGKSLA